MALKERLQALMSEYNLSTQQELADFAGVSKGLVGQWFNGQTGLGRKPLVAFEKKTNFSPRWLAEGYGEKYKNQTVLDRLSDGLAAGIAFELLNVQAAAGVGYFNDDFPEPLSRLVFSEHWVREHLGGTGKAVKLISVKGDSMSPTFNHGDFLFVDTAADFYNGEGVYVFAAAGELRVKRLQSSVRGGMNVISDNRNYNAEYLPPDDWAAVKVCGRVVYRLAGERV
ncbi:TPA: helix-turn-helix transcriptional regulator [Neisseria meningitidis]